MYADDTIAAIATPPGPGGVGIVRVSGRLSREIAGAVFAPRHAPAQWISHHLYYGQVVDAHGEALDEGLAVLMHGPHSYTGEDVLELHCHGSPVALRRVLACVLACGARSAEKGEFTKRAFLNGRLDLAQAEAVIEMVQARTEAGAALAMQQLSGRLSAHLAKLRAQLIHLKALLEAQIDFSEEDVDIGSQELRSELDNCMMLINRLIDTYHHGKLIRDGLRVAIIGKPNVGKSSLLNALLGEERAIVTPVAGTTRDAIDETVAFDGVPVIVSDTAGLRAHGQADLIERLGMQRATEKISESDLLLTVLDASGPLDAADYAILETARAAPHLIVLNKVDLGEQLSPEDVTLLASGHRLVRISAKERFGLDDLRRAVVAHATDGSTPGSTGPVLTNLRHEDALRKAATSLALARQSVSDCRHPELVAVDVQDAIDHIGSVTGVITCEEVLSRIFSEFCIGK